MEALRTQGDALRVLARDPEVRGGDDGVAHEPKNVVNNVKYTIDLPILRDNDFEVTEHFEVCEGQFANANNGKGVNYREKINFMRNTLEKGGTRRASWDLKMRELRETGLLTENPKAAYESLIQDLRDVIPETDLELRLQKKMEFDGLEQGRTSHADFHVRFRKLLYELKRADCLKMDEDDLFLAYVSKVTPGLRNEIRKRRTMFAEDRPRLARTRAERKQVCDEYVREGKNVAALRERHGQTVYAEGAAPPPAPPASGGVGSGSRCKLCNFPGHSTALCPTEAAKKRGSQVELRHLPRGWGHRS